MGEAHISLGARAGHLIALGEGLHRFGPFAGRDDWLTVVVWLCTDSEAFLAGCERAILDGGRAAARLRIETPREFLDRLGSELEDVGARHPSLRQDDVPGMLRVPADLASWAGPTEALVIERNVDLGDSRSCTIGCGLLFRATGGRELMVAAQDDSPALLLTEDEQVIREWCQSAALVPLADYLKRLEG